MTGRLNYRIAGRGRPLMFIHGWGTNLSVWMKQIDYFSSQYCTVNVDLRGCGGSEWADGNDCTLRELAEDIHLLCRQLSLENVSFIGWSLGAMVALELIDKFSVNAKNLVLVGATPKFCRGDGFAAGLAPQRIRWLARGLERNYAGTLESSYRELFTEEEKSASDFPLIWNNLIKGSTLSYKQSFLKTLTAIERADLRDNLGRISASTLIIHGERDTICLPEAARFMRNNIPDSKLKFIRGVGHAPFLTRPVEFNRIVEEFLNCPD